MPNKISLVIVHWNTPDLLKQQLQTFTQADWQIIVINNNPDINLNLLKKQYPQINLVQNSFNRGFAFACNQGITLAKNEWIFFLNPDVLIENNEIEQLANEAINNNWVAISPLTDSHNYQKPLPSFLSLLKEFTPLAKIIPSFIFRHKTLTGGALLIKKSVIEKLAGWDERFFLWFEDSDLTQRLIDAKFKIGFSKMTVKHYGGVSFQAWSEQQKRDIFFHALKVYALKHFSFGARLVVNFIQQRFSNRKLLPILNQEITITVPNLKLNLLTAFLEKNYQFIKNHELIIVTSAVNTDQFWQLKKQYPTVRLIKIRQNHGFAATVNLGFRVSPTAWLATVNDDVILTKDSLEVCFNNLSNNVGAINPIIKTFDNKIESAGIKVLKIGKALPITDLPQQTFTNIDACNAACVLYRNQALNKAGLFDEKFGSYLEDIDLSLRITNAGWKNIICANSEVIHLKHQSSKHLYWRKNYLDLKNWCLVIAKNWSLKQKVKYLPGILLERLKNLSGLLKAIF